jgi:hypothetical protein
LVASGVFLQRAAGFADERLNTLVKYASAKASVQDVVQSLAEQAGLKYEWQKSFTQTKPLCNSWVHSVAIEGKTCHEALEQVLKPVGLHYEVENGTMVLSRLSDVPAASPGPSEPPKFHAAREALRGPQKDTARAKKLLLEIVGTDRASFPQARLDPNASADDFYRLLFQ